MLLVTPVKNVHFLLLAFFRAVGYVSAVILTSNRFASWAP